MVDIFERTPMEKPVRRKRKPSEIPPSELRKRLINEGRHAHIVDFIIEQRMAKARKKQSEGGVKGLRIRRQAAYKPLLADIAKVIKKIRDRMAYIERTDSSAESEKARALSFLKTSLAQAMLARDTLKRFIQQGRVAPAQWQSLIDPRRDDDRLMAYRVMTGRHQDRLAPIEQALSGVKTSPIATSVAKTPVVPT